MMSRKIEIFETKSEMGRAAAIAGANLIREAIHNQGTANIIVATGASQFELLENLVTEDIPWQNVSVFHLDEYVGLPISHPASFRLYLWKRFASRLPVPTAAFYYLNAEEDPQQECELVGSILQESEIDVAFVGIGENGHLAFNDPPADFETNDPYIVVELDEACRQQQVAEGWFNSLEEVPTRAISMSINQIMKSRSIICTVPDVRKSVAVKHCLEDEVSPSWPAAILQQHENCQFFFDSHAASKLSENE